MIVEKEAREIRCCGPAHCGWIDMRYGGPDGIRLCIGAKCAGWRWVDVPNPEYKPMRTSVYYDGVGPPAHIKSTTVGYCGLAGRP